MQTEAIFENIAERIGQEISRAQSSVFIAVAWFTNQSLYNALVNKVKTGCTVSLLLSNDAINQNSAIDFDALNIGLSRVYFIGNGDTELMHNKFCVIDHNTIITGSYNWSYKAEKNFENVIITKDDPVLAEQFIAEFNKIRQKYYPDAENTEQDFPVSKIIKRFEILKNYILLEDTEELQKEAGKLSPYSFNEDINQIINCLQQKEYAAAVSGIQKFIKQYQQLSIWTDPEIAALKLEIKNLENQLNAFDNEKIELEKLLSEFQHRHAKELGQIILEILKLRKLKFKTDKVKYEEAENDEREYREQVNEEKQRQVFDLNEDEKQELKRKFRRATTLCHPDKVSDEFKDAAQRIFIDLKSAYDSNNLQKVNELLADLERGNYFRSRSETVNEKDLLKAAIAKLRNQIKNLEAEITHIKTSEAYNTVKNITDWDEYFANTKQKLEKELEYLSAEIDISI